MMKAVFIAILFFMTTQHTEAQPLTDKELTGKWKVVKLESLMPDVREDQKANFELMKAAFLKAKFDFKADHTCSFHVGSSDLDIDKAHWEIDNSIETVVIEEIKSNGAKQTLMQISATKENDKIIFLISNIFFALEVVRE